MAADTTTASTALTMKLLIDSRPLRRRVVFAEAGKGAVDFLFSLLAMPAGTALKLLAKESMVGSVGNLYASVEKLDGAYVRPGASKDALLCPAVLSPAASPGSSLFRLPEPSKAFFKCSSAFVNYSCYSYVTDARGTRCPNCRNEMTTESQYVVPPGPGGGGGEGFVQGTVTYTVTDDLTIEPMSAISSITLLSASAVRGLAALQEKTVQLGYKEGLEILKASLQSKTVLTDVFLGKTKMPPSSNNSTTPRSNNGRRHERLTWRA